MKKSLLARVKIAAVLVGIFISRVASSQTELIVNGGFESGSTGWVLAGGAAVSSGGGLARSGTAFLWLGGVEDEIDFGYQAVTIPANATTATLSFYWNIDSEEDAFFPYDFFTITIRDSGNAILATVRTLSNMDQTAPGNPFYSRQTFNLLPYAGQTIRIHFASANDSSLVTNFRVDDVSIVALAGDDNDQIGEAISGGPLTHTIIGGGTINPGTDVDMWSFTVTAGQRISFDIDLPGGSAFDSYIRLFDSSGTPLSGGSNDNGIAPGESPGLGSYLERTFTMGGTYYVGVSGRGNNNYDPVGGDGDQNGSTGDYTLIISPGLTGWAYRPDDDTDHPVDILRLGADPPPINAGQRAWIVVHGRGSSRDEPNISALAQALATARPADQVLTLDWREAARITSDLDFGGEEAIINVATWAAAALTGYGFSSANLNFVGHSWGSYVSGETAERISGGVDTIIALDPAADAPFGYNPNSNGEINFARDSQFSVAFHTSFYGSEFTPTTADECFVTPHDHQCIPPSCDIPAHSYPVLLTTWMLGHAKGGVSGLFQPGRFLSHLPGPWIANRYSSHEGDEGSGTPGYEGVILATADGLAPDWIRYFSTATGLEVTVPEIAARLSAVRQAGNVVIKWSTNTPGYSLEYTVNLPATAWNPASPSPVVVGSEYVVTNATSGNARFYRLQKR
jgi:pimeloyl-ACP methyl ester carboxylesterase